MPTIKQTIAGLECRIYDELPEGTAPRALVVLCHGFGAAGHDLAGLGREILRQYPDLAGAARFVFPAAPIPLDEVGIPGGRAWWMLDIEKLNRAIQRGELRDLRNDHPPELPAAREQLTELLAIVTRDAGLPMSQVVLGGFSQGSMLATDVSLRLPEPPGHLAVLSGSLLAEDEWRELAQRRGPLSVFQSHGYQDPILPYQTAEWLRDLLVDSGIDVEFHPFQGMHEIPAAAIVRIAERTQSLCESE